MSDLRDLEDKITNILYRAYGFPLGHRHVAREVLALPAIASALAGHTPGPYEARIVPSGMPSDVCHYGVISLSRGIEVCRVWTEQDARAIATALAGRDAVIEQCAGAAENARVRCDWNGCHFAGPNPSGCAYPDDILEYRYSVDVAEAIRALKLKQ